MGYNAFHTLTRAGKPPVRELFALFSFLRGAIGLDYTQYRNVIKKGSVFKPFCSLVYRRGPGPRYSNPFLRRGLLLFWAESLTLSASLSKAIRCLRVGFTRGPVQHPLQRSNRNNNAASDPNVRQLVSFDGVVRGAAANP